MKNLLLYVVFVIRNEGDSVAEIIKEATIYLQKLVEDYELIIVDNASSDNTFFTLNVSNLNLKRVVEIKINRDVL